MNFIERYKKGKKPQGGWVSMTERCIEYYRDMYKEMKAEEERYSLFFKCLLKYRGYQRLMPNW